MPRSEHLDPKLLARQLQDWGLELGFAGVGISRLQLDDDRGHLREWLAHGRHGTLDYMQRSADMRGMPAQLRPGTLSVVSARMNCLPAAAGAQDILADGSRAYIARYALGRDYHRTLRSRLIRLAERLRLEIAPFGYRVLADSAPALEKAMARDAGLGWIGKNTLLMNRESGSFFLLGEIYCDLELPSEPLPPPASHCGSCSACMDICPTQAIVGPRQLDARRCISYLTIENRGPIPLEFRKAIGNRIFGCDDCQLVCPWNRQAQLSQEADFAPRHGLDQATLTSLFAWSESDYLEKTRGMALRRTNYPGWLRNIAVALGNAPTSTAVVAALQARREESDEMVREHVVWALAQHGISGP